MAGATDVYVVKPGGVKCVNSAAELPKKGDYYVVAANGFFAHKDNTTWHGFTPSPVPIPPLVGLKPLDSKLEMLLPRMPQVCFLKAALFFQEVWSRYRSEVELDLRYNPDKRAYMLNCPVQDVSGGHVDYNDDYNSEKNLTDRKEVQLFRKTRWLRVGSIHSHCNFSAFHSDEDLRDEIRKNGLHITIGHVDRKQFSLAASFTVQTNRQKLNPLNVINGIKHCRSEFYELTTRNDKHCQQLLRQIEDSWLPLVNAGMQYVKPVLEPPKLSELVFEMPKVKLLTYVPKPVLTNYERQQLLKIRSHAVSLLYFRPKLPTFQEVVLLRTLQDFYKRDDIGDDDIALAARINPERKVYG